MNPLTTTQKLRLMRKKMEYKVKLISATEDMLFETKINNFLEREEVKKLIDIKLYLDPPRAMHAEGYHGATSERYDPYSYALIIYESK